MDSKHLSDLTMAAPVRAHGGRPAMPVCGIAVFVGLLATSCTRIDTAPRMDGYRPPARDRAAVRRTAPPGTSGTAVSPVQTIELGKSIRGVPLTLRLFGSGRECIFIFGGIHGSEPTSAALAHQLETYLRSHPDVLAGRSVAVLAAANPDGLHERQRTNANGVDLNRNFPAVNWCRAGRGEQGHGQAPGSEPETRAIIRIVEVLQPTRIV